MHLLKDINKIGSIFYQEVGVRACGIGACLGPRGLPGASTRVRA